MRFEWQRCHIDVRRDFNRLYIIIIIIIIIITIIRHYQSINQSLINQSLNHLPSFILPLRHLHQQQHHLSVTYSVN